MDIITLLIAALVTAILVWLAQSGKVPAPFHWILWAILIVIWLVVLIRILGLNLQTSLG